MYWPEEGWQIQDPKGNGGGVTRSIKIDGDVAKSMVERLVLAVFWHFSMVRAIYIVDHNHSLLGVFLFSFLYFVLVRIIIVVVSHSFLWFFLLLSPFQGVEFLCLFLCF